MELRAARLLKRKMQVGAGHPHGVLLSGGKTPLGLYRRIQAHPFAVDPECRILLSDERHVPPDSPESNYGAMRGMIRALGVPRRRVLNVSAGLRLRDAADRYDRRLNAFLKRGGRISLGFLGLGVDGHTASLFSEDQIAGGEGRWAIAVRRPDGRGGVSVTRDLLARAERIVFFVAGPEKRKAVNRLLLNPDSLPAGVAAGGSRRIEVWYWPGGAGENA
jgi:6-phosphogluconolactonase